MRFGRLVVLEPAGRSRAGNAKWLCRCDCGSETIARSGNLRQGTTNSCGCLRKIKQAEVHARHNGKGTRLYTIWRGMRVRCYYPKYKSYRYYGGRGIKVSPAWEDFSVFQEWARANGYGDDLTLDRIDPDGDYRPDNCRWATWSEQRLNQRRRKEVVE